MRLRVEAQYKAPLNGTTVRSSAAICRRMDTGPQECRPCRAALTPREGSRITERTNAHRAVATPTAPIDAGLAAWNRQQKQH